MKSKVIKINIELELTGDDNLEQLSKLLTSLSGIKNGCESQNKSCVKTLSKNEDAKQKKSNDKKQTVKTDDSKSAEKTNSQITIEEVRAAVTSKVENNREAIKEKLTEMGARKITELDPSKFSEFVDFLESL